MAEADSTPTNAGAFGTRLIEALELQGFTEYKQQVDQVAQCLGVKCATAETYLKSSEFPAFLSRRPKLLFELAGVLDVPVMWLFNGSGPNPKVIRVMKAMESMTEWEQTKYLRFCIRLLNNDAKAIRLSGMQINGRISRQQFFAAM